MLWLHQIHQLQAPTKYQFETLIRDSWLPALAGQSGVRLAWYATPTRGAIRADEAVTITGIADGATLARFGAEIHTGSLSHLAAKIADLRTGVQTRVFQPLDYDPFAIRDVSDIPSEPQDGARIAYMHDFVPPTQGNMVGYEDMMRERYMALTGRELSGVGLRASWRTVPGGGPQPEMFNLSEIRDVDALERLICFEIPPEFKEMGTWMWSALAVRDRWTTRLLRSSSWSPVR